MAGKTLKTCSSLKADTPSFHDVVDFAFSGNLYFPKNTSKQFDLYKKLIRDPNFPDFWELAASPDDRNDIIKTELYYRQALKIALSSNVSTENLVLFSTTPINEIHAANYVETLHNHDFILTTPCGLMLDWLKIMDRNNPVYDAELSHLAMYGASFRLAKETKSKNVRAFIYGAAPASTFRMVETIGLRLNKNVISINDLPKEHHVTKWHTPHFISWLGEYIENKVPKASPLVTRFTEAARPVNSNIANTVKRSMLVNYCKSVFAGIEQPKYCAVRKKTALWRPPLHKDFREQTCEAA